MRHTFGAGATVDRHGTSMVLRLYKANDKPIMRAGVTIISRKEVVERLTVQAA